MRAAVFQGVGRRLSIERVPDPEPAADQVVIEVARAGICGSDLHMAEHGAALPGLIFGHEFAGTIVAMGADVTGSLTIGDRVTALPVQACRRCEACDEGLYALCGSVAFTGTTPSQQGAYAEFVGARSALVQRLPNGVGFDEGAMVEPLAVAYHAVDRAELRPGASVLVIGAGPIGAGVALFARLRGARHVVVSERSPHRRTLATSVGATSTIDPTTENVAERFTAMTGGRPDTVFECVGVPGMIQHAIDLAGVRGRVVVAGVCFGDDSIKPLSALMREVTISFSQCYTEGDFGAVIDAVARGDADPSPMHSLTIGLADLPEAFDGLRTDPSACKILIDPQRT